MERERGASRTEKENLFVVLPLSPYIPSILHLTILLKDPIVFFIYGKLEILETSLNTRRRNYIMKKNLFNEIRIFFNSNREIIN